MVEEEMLYYASVVKGQCLIITMNGRNEIKRDGLDCFVTAARYVGYIIILLFVTKSFSYHRSCVFLYFLKMIYIQTYRNTRFVS